MNLDINRILNLAKTLMPNTVKQLESAINKAQEVMQNSEGENPINILKNVGISNEFLDNLKKNTSNPIANIFMKAVGLDVDQANTFLDSLRASNSISNPTSSTPKSDDIEILKQALNKVKKN